jgi:hypothetical protein
MKYFTFKRARLYALLGLSLFLFAFNSIPDSDDTESNKRLVSLRSDEYEKFSSSVYKSIDFKSDTLDWEIFDKAFRGYLFLSKTSQLENKQYLSIIDFTSHCNKKRLWVIDLEKKELIYHEMVAHGVNTGKEYALYFSNKHSSNKSSLGFYTTGGTYYGRNGLSLKLHGLEKNFNDNAYSRGIVIHGAHYVDENYLKYNETIGRSYGCPAVSKGINSKLVNKLKGGSCLFIYHNAVHYQTNSELINANLYIPVDELTL